MTTTLDDHPIPLRALRSVPDPDRDYDDYLASVMNDDRTSTSPVLAGLEAKFLRGGSFIHDAPTEIPAIWGTGTQVLWAEGEPLMITGPSGVGKTSLGGQVLNARLGLQNQVLGYPVRPGKRVLYLAMDRPAQIRRALSRLLRNAPRQVLDERLVVWPGPPPLDLARHPTLLKELADLAGADTVILDSLKDAAVKLSDEETGQGLNRAMQLCVADGIEVMVYHHQTKRGAGGGEAKPRTLADVYGSAWLTAGMGSVLLLWGAAGDPIVELSHLKQPGEEVGPLQVLHDTTAGTSEVFEPERTDVYALLLDGPVTAREVAASLYGDNPSKSDVEKARRKIAQLVSDGHAVAVTEATAGGGGKGGGTAARYAARSREEPSESRSTQADSGSRSGAREINHDSGSRPDHAVTEKTVSAGSPDHVPDHEINTPSGSRSLPPLYGGEACAGSGPDSGFGGGRELEAWVRASLTTTPQTSSMINADIADTPGSPRLNAASVHTALERLATAGTITRHRGVAGLALWSLNPTTPGGAA